MPAPAFAGINSSGHPGSKRFVELIWIPASAGMTKDAIHPDFEKRGILPYIRKGMARM
jgi:hypothetical protein